MTGTGTTDTVLSIEERVKRIRWRGDMQGGRNRSQWMRFEGEAAFRLFRELSRKPYGQQPVLFVHSHDGQRVRLHEGWQVQPHCAIEDPGGSEERYRFWLGTASERCGDCFVYPPERARPGELPLLGVECLPEQAVRHVSVEVRVLASAPHGGPREYVFSGSLPTPPRDGYRENLTEERPYLEPGMRDVDALFRG